MVQSSDYIHRRTQSKNLPHRLSTIQIQLKMSVIAYDAPQKIPWHECTMTVPAPSITRLPNVYLFIKPYVSLSSFAKICQCRCGQRLRRSASELRTVLSSGPRSHGPHGSESDGHCPTHDLSINAVAAGKPRGSGSRDCSVADKP